MKTLTTPKAENKLIGAAIVLILPIAVFCVAAGIYEVATKLLPELLTDLITLIRWV